MSEYIETQLTLDSLDLIQIERLIEWRMGELEDSKTGDLIPDTLANEQLTNYAVTLTKIKDARAEVKRIKIEADKAYYATRK